MGGRGSVVADCLLSERRASGCLIRAVNSLTSAEASQRCGGLSRGRQPLHGSPHGDFRTDARRRWTRVQATDPVRSRGGRGRAWELWGSAAVAVGLHVASGDVCVRVDGGCRAPAAPHAVPRRHRVRRQSITAASARNAKSRIAPRSVGRRTAVRRNSRLRSVQVGCYRGARSSHPPVKPARRNPWMMYGFVRMTRHISSLR